MIRFIALLLLIGCASIRLDPAILHQMSLIELQEIQSIDEAKLYHRLSNILNTGSEPLYSLQFQIYYHQDDIGISKKFDVIRKGITQVINFQLVRKSDEKLLLKKTIIMRSSYSLVSDAMISYAQLSSNKNFLAISGAEKIKAHLILYFKRQINDSKQ